MPSVGMRRNTRVFGTRVLRSGRRLWTEPSKGSNNKNARASHAENKWTDIPDGGGGGGGGDAASDRLNHTPREYENSASSDTIVDPTVEERAPEGGGAVEVKDRDRMCGIVYRRKRKRKLVELGKTGLTEDKRYGKKFVRERWRKRFGATESFESCGKFGGSVRGRRELVVVVNESSNCCGYWVACFLNCVLSYMTKVRIGMRRMSAFMLSKPIFDVYSSHGVLFVQDAITARNNGIKKPGLCIISGSKSLLPIFSVDFSAIPSVFVHMQTSLYLRSEHLAFLLVARSTDDDYEEDEEVTAMDEEPYLFPSREQNQDCIADLASLDSPVRDVSCSGVLASGNDDSGGKIEFSSQSPLGLPKSSALRSLQLRNSRNIKKRRSSLRRKRGRPPSSFRTQKSSGALASDFFRIRNDAVQFSALSPTRLLRSSDKKNSDKKKSDKNSSDKKSSTSNIKETKPATQDMCPSTCSANILITETDKCYREEGATVALELSPSKQWFLVIGKDGTKRYNLTAEKVMRPSCSNRFSHAVIWSGDCNFKLEFSNKQDWFVFKELYKQCSERNMQSPSVSVIPVPGVQEVSMPFYNNFMPYVRPDDYITVKDDELIRALVKKGANYDMDSDDEEWLSEFNDELCGGMELQEPVSPECFELVIDALEKGVHCNPDENFEELAAYDFCMHLERREVIEAIRNYWVKKRKQKRSALVRIFQLYQPRRIQVIPKSVFRKKRSFKRQASQGGRGKQRPILQAIAAERDALEQQNNAQKLQEAKAAAERFEALAVEKRQRAQMLMENADLATYKAILALRIAEAAQLSEGSETVASFFAG
ncbi:hypothetical protein ACP275_06G180100 [Erythranthe tilingii]